MDERVFSYKAGSQIPAWDLRHRLSIHEPVSPECKDTGTLFRLNSTYMDVTDQPHRDRQWHAAGVLTSCIGVIAPLWLIGYTLIHPPREFVLSLGIAYFVLMGGSAIFAYLTFKYGRDEFFSLKRRPIRFNRKEKKVYAIRHRRFLAKPDQGDFTWEIAWDEKAIFCIHRRMVNNRPAYHIRHYEVDEHGNIIRAFAIGRTWEGNENLQSLLSQWNYWCWYMNRGPAELPKPPLFYKERETMLESFLFCLYEFAPYASVAYRVSMMPFILLLTAHRLLALWTCRNPVWPLAVEEVSSIEPDDPFDEPRGSTPSGWGDTLLAIERGEYPHDPGRGIDAWRGEKDPVANAHLWAQDIPPRLH
ncbi:hypothetical protein Hrubri_3420 [Herbaspirillum rubrisubalbicans M1]|uniref:DUF6708 domain-containing protein n=1 Tax=Herbaspirillum rubrisubalbicans TaxID=80842 RepID=UPI00073A384B|nr:DUF6708 domain-containing protein [Herbaspirillum rubrisubalbicans]ALU90580.1 hypothetical protein Hrubri_3420 [Herbaspirillum rubrisubalbicans M1]